MGKRFLIRAITDTVDDANAFMAKHPDTALIASFGTLHFIAKRSRGVCSIISCVESMKEITGKPLELLPAPQPGHPVSPHERHGQE